MSMPQVLQISQTLFQDRLNRNNYISLVKLDWSIRKKTRRTNHRQFPLHLPSPKNFLFMFNQLSSISGPVLIRFPPLFHPPFHHFPETFIQFPSNESTSSHFPAIFKPFSSHFPAIFHQVFLQGSPQQPQPPQDALEILRKAPKPSASQELRALQLLSQAETLLTNRCWC